jgi:serine/threonine protein kinase
MEDIYYSHQKDFPFRRMSYLSTGHSSLVQVVEGTEEPIRGKLYACKELRVSSHFDKEAKRLEERVESFKSAHHDHIVRIVATYCSEDRYAIVMEPVADTDLDWYLHNTELDDTERSPQVREKISQWFGCLTNALAFLHEKNIIHGGINPTHILISNNSVLLTCSTHWPPPSYHLFATAIYVHLGKSDMYRSPESIMGHPMSRRSDIFALGVVFTEMLVVGTQPQRREEFRKTFFDPDAEIQDRERNLARKWMDFFGQLPGTLPWQSRIAVISAEMLRNDHRERPKAGDLRLWWSCQTSTSLPSTPCKCSLAASVKDQQSPAKTKEALEIARAEGYAMSVEFLSGKAEEPDIKTARWGVKEAKQKDKRGLLQISSVFRRGPSPSTS